MPTAADVAAKATAELAEAATAVGSAAGGADLSAGSAPSVYEVRAGSCRRRFHGLPWPSTAFDGLRRPSVAFHKTVHAPSTDLPLALTFDGPSTDLPPTLDGPSTNLRRAAPRRPSTHLRRPSTHLPRTFHAPSTHPPRTFHAPSTHLPLTFDGLPSQVYWEPQAVAEARVRMLPVVVDGDPAYVTDVLQLPRGTYYLVKAPSEPLRSPSEPFSALRSPSEPFRVLPSPSKALRSPFGAPSEHF